MAKDAWATGQQGCLFSFASWVYDRMQLPATDCQKYFANLRETCDGKRCLGRQGNTVAYSPSPPGYMTGCSFNIFAPCRSWRGTKKTYVRQQARPGTSSKETSGGTGAKGTSDSQMADALSFGKRARQLLQVHFVLVIMFGTCPEPVVCLSFLVSYQN